MALQDYRVKQIIAAPGVSAVFCQRDTGEPFAIPLAGIALLEFGDGSTEMVGLSVHTQSPQFDLITARDAEMDNFLGFTAGKFQRDEWVGKGAKARACS